MKIASTRSAAHCSLLGLFIGAAVAHVSAQPIVTSQPQTAPASQPGPRLVLSRDAWDFGQVWHGISPILNLGLTNEGQADLVLTRVKTTCGCTLVSGAKDVLKPGESTILRVEFDTHGKQEHVTSKVLIDSNDSARPHVEFPISGYVKRAVLREPLGGLVIRTLDTKPGLSGTLRLKNQTEQPMQLKLLAQNIDELEFELKEERPGMEYTVIGRTTKPVRPGITRGQFVIATGLEREPELTLDARITVLPYVETVPAAVFIDATDPNAATKPTNRVVLIQYYGDTPKFQVTGTECKHPGVKVTYAGAVPPTGGMEQIKPTMTCWVRTEVTIPPATEIPAEGIVVTYKTNDPAHPLADVLITKDRPTWETLTYGPPPRPLPTSAPAKQ
jgi:hypothetical protein